MTDASRVSPYEMPQPPTSPGRALLSRAYEHFCVLHWGYSGDEIAVAFAGRDQEVARDLEWSSRLLGELLAAGDIRSCARPIGGGEPVALKPTLWELDDFVSRFAASALDLAAPFDGSRPPTHWIFVDVEDWNRIVDMLLGGCVGSAAPSPTPRPSAVPEATRRTLGKISAVQPGDYDRLVRLPEVMRRTSLSKATIYRRMSAERFPASQLLEGNIAVWREHEIAAWIADPH